MSKYQFEIQSIVKSIIVESVDMALPDELYVAIVRRTDKEGYQTLEKFIYENSVPSFDVADGTGGIDVIFLQRFRGPVDVAYWNSEEVKYNDKVVYL